VGLQKDSVKVRAYFGPEVKVGGGEGGRIVEMEKPQPGMEEVSIGGVSHRFSMS